MFHYGGSEFSYYEALTDVIVLDNRIIAGGKVEENTSSRPTSPALAAFTDTGVPDTVFGTNGVTLLTPTST